MDLGLKSKRFGFKSRRQNEKDQRNWFDDSEDKIEFDDISKPSNFCKDVPKTPVRSLQSCNISPISQNSPQFRVGWNDGSQKNNCDMSSPVNISVRRKIRRCPENLLSKITTPLEQINDENCCDILQCINFARSVIEFSKSPSCNNDDNYNSVDENVIQITESIKDTSLDILDDSSNELMILCSQAVEESVTTGTLRSSSLNPPSGKHSVTPKHDRSVFKKFKNDQSSGSKNISSFNDRLTRVFEDSHNPKSRDNLVAESVIRKSNTSSKVQNKSDDFKRPRLLLNNNNCTRLKNLNENSTASISNIAEKRIPTSNSKFDISLPNQRTFAPSDNIISHLDDDDDLFCSLDFNFLDSLQTQLSQQSQATSKPFTIAGKPQSKNSTPLKLDIKPLVTKYTKEEIEKRRIEAKKRLLFNKKHRSM